jgi:LAO/AO transport system kinase
MTKQRTNAKSREEELVEQVLQGNELALARLISVVENEPNRMAKILPGIQLSLGRAHCIGFTGPPGAGKSSLVNQVTKVLRAKEKKVGIIAVDPTSPFSGGAFLGDRIRMQSHYLDPGVFIRSMATRGSYGGLAQATKDVIKVMDAYGMEYVLVETVGVGQTELDIMQTTDTTVVVLVPEGGDSVQAMKAGLMEIGDIFVINKADRPGAEDIAMQLRVILQMNPRYQKNLPPILLTQSIDGIGVEELADAIKTHKLALKDEELTGRRKERRKVEFEEVLKQMAVREWKIITKNSRKAQELLTDVIEGKVDPYSALKEVFPRGVLNFNNSKEEK